MGKDWNDRLNIVDRKVYIYEGKEIGTNLK